MNTSKFILGLLTVFIFLLLVVGFYSVISKKSSIKTVTTKATETSIVLGEFKTYKDPAGSFTLSYPKDYEIEYLDEGRQTQFSKIGRGARINDPYNGVSMVIEPVGLSGLSLANWTDAYVGNRISDGTFEMIDPKKKVEINENYGFTFTIRNEQISRVYVLQKSEKSQYALVVTATVYDPLNFGFQKQVDQVLSSLAILK